MTDTWLTAADLEPPVGTIVETEDGARWWRDATHVGATCNWFPMRELTNPDRHDPKSWTKVAGNYGPVKVVFLKSGTHGLEPFDLAPPGKVLVPLAEPLRWGFVDRGRFDREQREREERLQQQLEDARQDWQELHDRLAGNPIAVAVLNYHEPDKSYDCITCDTCMGDENYEASPQTWPCGTFTTVKKAAIKPSPALENGADA